MRSSFPPEALVGSLLETGHRVLQLLGSGGIAHVYLVERPADASRPGAERHRMAIKVLRAEHEGSLELSARFEREALAGARVRHPNVLEVHGLERLEDGRLFFRMELLVGLDLADTLNHTRALAPARAARIAASIADGLGAAHHAGVIHRDVKPENVFLVHAADGRELVKLLDFGFASVAPAEVAPGAAPPPPTRRITSRTTVVGTPEYMAPEQAYGGDARPTADVYSLGIVLYEMLVGRAPFLGSSYVAIAAKHAHEAPPPLRRLHPGLVVSAELDALVARSLDKAPDARPPSMAAFAAALRATPEGAGSDRARGPG